MTNVFAVLRCGILSSAQVLLMTIQNPPPTLESDTGKKHFSKSMRDIVAKCLVKDPSKRPSAAQLLEHKFFKVRSPSAFGSQPPTVWCARSAQYFRGQTVANRHATFWLHVIAALISSSGTRWHVVVAW